MIKNIIILLSLFILFVPVAAFAKLIPDRIVPECITPGITVSQPDGTTKTVAACGLCDFFLLVKNIFDFIAFALVPAVGAFIFLIAGFLFLTSGGSEQRVGQAKKLFVGVVIGAAIVYVAWIGVGSLINAIGKKGDIDGWKPETWNSFICNKP